MSLKHLGGLLEAADGPTKALECYVAAVSLDSGDVVLWRATARLALATRQWGLARLALEHGLSLSARHPLLLQDLMELLLAVGDSLACEVRVLSSQQPPGLRLFTRPPHSFTSILSSSSFE